MSVLDDARRLAEIDPWYEHERAGTSFCIACGAYEDHTGRHHNPDCSWRALPGIVAALEAAERLAYRFYYADKTETNALMAALVAALRGPTESPEPSPLTGTTC